MRIWVVAIISLTAFTVGCHKRSDVPYEPTRGEVATPLDEVLESFEGYVFERTNAKTAASAESAESGKIRHTIDVYPTEAYFGDTIYITETFENISDVDIPDFDKTGSDVWDMPGFHLSISSPQLEEKYRWSFENPTGSTACREGVFEPLKAGEKFCAKFLYPELCPLEAYDAPFWKELREKLPPEGIVCTLEIEAKDKFKVAQDVLVKPRPAEETALLEKWYKNTPEELLPTHYDGALRNNGASNIRLSSIPLKTYDPWIFIPAGYRKPSNPNNPTTVEGWRRLEANLVPSTMRDQIRLARLHVEYCATRDPDEAIKVKKEYDEWLASLPEVQRAVMKSYPYCPTESYQKHPEVDAKLGRLKRG